MVVWLSYSIHGDESSAFEAGMQVLYQLTASDDPKIADVLQKCVVLINPAQNPDGHERFTAWYNAQGLGRPEAFAFEHHQPWGIYGRFNHYLFDLNRDLLPGSQIESRAADGGVSRMASAGQRRPPRRDQEFLLPAARHAGQPGAAARRDREMAEPARARATRRRSTATIGCITTATCSTCIIPVTGIAGRACTGPRA